MTLAEKILSLRTERGMSQDDLAEKLEVSRQSVSKWETGQSTPDLDKIIKLADLFGVSVDELVREGERPRPPKPPEPKVIYVEREKRGLTRVQTTGIILAALGLVFVIIGFKNVDLLMLLGLALVILSLPLILAKKHPWLIAGWLAVGLSLVILSPYTSVCPWGLTGGLRMLYHMAVNPALRFRAYYFAAIVGIVRGLVTLALIVFTGRACGKVWKSKRFPETKE